MKPLFTISLLLCSLLLHAQQQRYFILFQKGNVQVKQPGHSSVKARSMQLLTWNDSVQLTDGLSEVTIGNTAGSHTTFRGKGSYKITDVQNNEGLKSIGASSKFFAYLYEELLQPKKGFSQQSVAASWGGGSRGPCNELKWPLDNAVSSRDTVLFTWKHSSQTLNYNFTLSDKDGIDIFSFNVRDTQVVIHTWMLKSEGKSEYYWSVNAVNRPCMSPPRNFIELISRQEEEKRVSDIVREVKIIDNEALYNLEIADNLGQHGFIDRALEYFNRGYEKIKIKKQ